MTAEYLISILNRLPENQKSFEFKTIKQTYDGVILINEDREVLKYKYGYGWDNILLIPWEKKKNKRA